MATKSVTDVTQRKPKKEAALGMRLTRETKDALDNLAGREGRSVSQVAERLLERAIAGQADMDARLGDGGIAQALLAMADFARDVQVQIGNPEKQLEARDALTAGWARMIENALPFTPDTAEGVTARMARVEARLNAGLLVEQLATMLEADELSDEEQSWIFKASDGQNALAPRSLPRQSLTDALLTFRHGTDGLANAPALIAMLNNAPPSLGRLTPSPAEVAKAVQTSLEALSRYMAPRRAARVRGQALAESRAGIGPVS